MTMAVAIMLSVKTLILACFKKKMQIKSIEKPVATAKIRVI